MPSSPPSRIPNTVLSYEFGFLAEELDDESSLLSEVLDDLSNIPIYEYNVLAELLLSTIPTEEELEL
jgi:hypothetical protein